MPESNVCKQKKNEMTDNRKNKTEQVWQRPQKNNTHGRV